MKGSRGISLCGGERPISIIDLFLTVGKFSCMLTTLMKQGTVKKKSVIPQGPRVLRCPL